MHTARRASSCRRESLALALLVLVLGGCSTEPTPAVSLQQVEARGYSVNEAQRVALQQAEAQCQGHAPLVLDRRVTPATPTFTADTPASPAPSETLALAATTHEGESPAIQLGFHCGNAGGEETP